MSDEQSTVDLSVASLFHVSGTYALVTGGSSGLGFQMAKALLQAGIRHHCIAQAAALR